MSCLTSATANAQERPSAPARIQAGLHADQRTEDPQHPTDPLERADPRYKLRDLRRPDPEDDLRGHPVSVVQDDRRGLSDPVDGGHGRADTGLLLYHVHKSGGRGTRHHPTRSIRDLAGQEDTCPGERE